MRLLLVPDKFKGSLSASEVCRAIEEGVRRHFPEAECHSFSASDGGDGFLDAVRAIRPVDTRSHTVSGPLGQPVQAEYLLDGPASEAFVEMAQASGLVLIEPSLRNPLRANTRGTGQLIHAAISDGAQRIYVGLGGSATSDGGMGIGYEFGFRFLDIHGDELPPNGANLREIHRVIPPSVSLLPEGREIIAVNDVANPLWGPSGAAYVYAPQKGADPAAVALLDQGLRQLDQCVRRDLEIDAALLPGAGAAGGTAFGLRAFLGATFISGTRYILERSGARAFLEEQEVDFICTGEGAFDAQSLQGKWINGVMELATPMNLPVLVVCGRCDMAREEWVQAGLSAVIEVSDPGRPLRWNMEHAFKLVKEGVANYFSGL